LLPQDEKLKDDDERNSSMDSCNTEKLKSFLLEKNEDKNPKASFGYNPAMDN
jgi:hypothetical protein